LVNSTATDHYARAGMRPGGARAWEV